MFSLNILNEKIFKSIKCLGKGSWAVISVLTSDKNDVAVKIVQKWNVWKIEDRDWPILQHTNLLAVTNTMITDELNVKLYFMPILP